MSNCYDINIKQNYWEFSDTFEDMLKKKKQFEKQVKHHLDYFETISTKEKFQKEWNEIYGDIST
tara:strand:+ start:74 stop:265 length:192 start_codon:yes stop_codon:yes gene_type:complete